MEILSGCLGVILGAVVSWITNTIALKRQALKDKFCLVYSPIRRWHHLSFASNDSSDVYFADITKEELSSFINICEKIDLAPTLLVDEYEGLICLKNTQSLNQSVDDSARAYSPEKVKIDEEINDLYSKFINHIERLYNDAKRGLGY